MSLLRALGDAQTPPDGPLQARAFDFRGRLTRVALSRDVFASAGAQVVLPEQTCRHLPADVQAMVRRHCGSAARDDPARSRARPMIQRSAPARTGDVPRLALERLGRWIQEHGQHLDGHPARTAPSPLYGVYEHEELVAVSLRLAARQLARFTPGGDPNTLWDAWRARGWLRHDPDQVTLRLRVGDQRRRWLALTWAAWQTATGERPSETTAEGSDHEAHAAESASPAPTGERHVGRGTLSGRG